MSANKKQLLYRAIEDIRSLVAKIDKIQDIKAEIKDLWGSKLYPGTVFLKWMQKAMDYYLSLKDEEVFMVYSWGFDLIKIFVRWISEDIIVLYYSFRSWPGLYKELSSLHYSKVWGLYRLLTAPCIEVTFLPQSYYICSWIGLSGDLMRSLAFVSHIRRSWPKNKFHYQKPINIYMYKWNWSLSSPSYI